MLWNIYIIVTSVIFIRLLFPRSIPLNSITSTKYMQSLYDDKCMMTRAGVLAAHHAKQPTIGHRSEESITIQIYLYRTWKVVLLWLLVRINAHNRSICTFYLHHFLFHGSFHVCFLEETQLHFSFVITLKYSTFLPSQVNFPVTSMHNLFAATVLWVLTRFWSTQFPHEHLQQK
jgi:hypothetical protein